MTARTEATDTPLVALVRAAMAAGIGWVGENMHRLRDSGEALGDILGTWPEEFLAIRPSLADEVREQFEQERAARQPAPPAIERPRPAHELVFAYEYDGGGAVTTKLVCTDPECRYRWAGDCDCEVYYDVKQHEDGSRTHTATEYDDQDEPHDELHRMHLTDTCNFAEWLNVGDEILDLSEPVTAFEIGHIPVVPVWHGNEGVTWIRPEDQRSCRGCGCTDQDCSQCIARTGRPCTWIEADLCSACAESET